MEYKCDPCNYQTDIESRYLNHLDTKKHKKNTGDEKIKHECDKCGMEFSNKTKKNKHYCDMAEVNKLAKINTSPSSLSYKQVLAKHMDVFTEEKKNPKKQLKQKK